MSSLDGWSPEPFASNNDTISPPDIKDGPWSTLVPDSPTWVSVAKAKRQYATIYFL